MFVMLLSLEKLQKLIFITEKVVAQVINGGLRHVQLLLVADHLLLLILGPIKVITLLFFCQCWHPLLIYTLALFSL
jgi:hypothetical protein